jgi:hypothetical protein
MQIRVHGAQQGVPGSNTPDMCRTSVPPFSKPFQKPRLVSWPPPLSSWVALSKKQNLYSEDQAGAHMCTVHITAPDLLGCMCWCRRGAETLIDSS